VSLFAADLINTAEVTSRKTRRLCLLAYPV